MVMVVAEAGVNHNGSVDLAHKLVEAAEACGADAVKFQVFDAETLEPNGPRREMLKGLQFSRDVFKGLKAHCDKLGIEFMATPFDPDSAAFLVMLGVKHIKIGSADIRNDPLLLAVRGRRVILSTGMATLDEIERAALMVATERTGRPILLHCTSAYPVPVKDVNLRAMLTLRSYGSEVGLSDHTLSLIIPAAAVAMGATVIEKHLTLDNRADGPDHRASLEPWEFTDMVCHIREIELALGDGRKRVMPSEATVVQVRDEREAYRCAS
jgi:N,N'-diacetyllegionaminate synthase